jgi:curved DNA-binding protein CbpA
MKAHYDILKVAKDAPLEDIRSTYKKLALKYHPDRIAYQMRLANPDVTDSQIAEQKKNGETKFKEISLAHEILSDTEKRQNYDRELAQPAMPVHRHFGCYTTGDWDAFFAPFPDGINVDAGSVQSMMTAINNKLQRIIDKAHYDCRYRKVSMVISTLKNKIADDQAIFFPHLTTSQHVSAADMNDFLIQTMLTIQQAIDTKEPETHRGLLRGTPILRELTMLLVALLRLVLFIFQKLAKYIELCSNLVYGKNKLGGVSC